MRRKANTILFMCTCILAVGVTGCLDKVTEGLAAGLESASQEVITTTFDLVSLPVDAFLQNLRAALTGS